MVRRKNAWKTSSGGAELPKLEFEPSAGLDERQGILIACRSLEQWGPTMLMVAQALKLRANQILMDFSQQGCAVRFRADGLRESMLPMDCPTGDGALVILKQLRMLNPADCRNCQAAKLQVNRKEADWILDFVGFRQPRCSLG